MHCQASASVPWSWVSLGPELPDQGAVHLDVEVVDTVPSFLPPPRLRLLLYWREPPSSLYRLGPRGAPSATGPHGYSASHYPSRDMQDMTTVSIGFPPPRPPFSFFFRGVSGRIVDTLCWRVLLFSTRLVLGSRQASISQHSKPSRRGRSIGDVDQTLRQPARSRGGGEDTEQSCRACPKPTRQHRKLQRQLGRWAARLRACSHTSVLVHGLRPDAQEESCLALN